MSRSGLITLLTVAVALGASAQQAKYERLNKRIPRADSAKYPRLRDPTDWQNPFLTVVQDGIQVRIGEWSPITIPSSQTMPAKDVVGYLNSLPNQAWPYGLVVVVAETGVHIEGDEARLRNEYKDLMDRLHRAGIAVYRWGGTE